jgi:hypothetical protein
LPTNLGFSTVWKTDLLADLQRGRQRGIVTKLPRRASREIITKVPGRLETDLHIILIELVVSSFKSSGGGRDWSSVGKRDAVFQASIRRPARGVVVKSLQTLTHVAAESDLVRVEAAEVVSEISACALLAQEVAKAPDAAYQTLAYLAEEPSWPLPGPREIYYLKTRLAVGILQRRVDA